MSSSSASAASAAAPRRIFVDDDVDLPVALEDRVAPVFAPVTTNNNVVTSAANATTTSAANAAAVAPGASVPDANDSVPTLESATLKSKFADRCGDFVFRTIKFVQRGVDYSRIDELGFDDRVVSKLARFSNLKDLFAEAQSKTGVKNYRAYSDKPFSFSTHANPLRGDFHAGTFIDGKSENVCTLDPITLELLPVRECESGIVVPWPGDVICGIVDPESNEKRGEFEYKRFSKWFICSEQFMRMWTLIYLPTHVSIAKDLTSRETFRKYILTSSNKLSTNTYRRWRLWHEDGREGKPKFTPADAVKRHWLLRHEPCAAERCHLYNALALAICFAEMPCDENTPTGQEFTLSYWDLPDAWHDKFFESWV